MASSFTGSAHPPFPGYDTRKNAASPEYNDDILCQSNCRKKYGGVKTQQSIVECNDLKLQIGLNFLDRE
jgi:hypothetical protein